MSKIRVLIVDDHSLVREGIGAILGFFDDVEVVGEAWDGKTAIERTESLKPHVVLMDIAMPGLGGLESTLEIKRRNPDVRVLILSQYDDREYVSRFVKAGVHGYILKHAVGTDLISAIRAVARGEYYIYPALASGIIEGFMGDNHEGPDDPYEKLTEREKQILKLIAEGLSHKEIGVALDISSKTVIAHQTNISEKIDIHSRAGLIKFAIKKRLIQID